MWFLLKFFTLFVFAMISLRVHIFLLNKFSIVDDLNKIGNHSQKTARGAGIVVVCFPYLIVLVDILFFIKNFYTNFNLVYKNFFFNYIFFLVSVISITMFFFIEDIREINYKIRLLVLIFFSTILTYLCKTELDYIFNFIPFYIRYPLCIIGYTWFMNLYNFMDGIDLMTFSETLFIKVSLILLILIKITTVYNYGEELLYAKFIIHSILIFLPFLFSFGIFNKPNAKVFIGDSGTIGIGFAVAFFLTKSTKIIGINACAILPMYYIMDSTISLVRRILNKENIFQPNNAAFFFQFIKRAKNNTYIVIIKIFTLNMILFFISYKVVTEKINNIFGLILSIFITSWLLFYFNLYKNKTSIQ